MGCPMCGEREFVNIGTLGHRAHVRCRACGFNYVMGDAYEDDYDEFDEENFAIAGKGGALEIDDDDRDDIPGEGENIDDIY